MNVGATEARPWLVVIGYGNELRGDDGAGRHVARAVRELNLPGVKVVDVQQLVPEIVDEIASADLVLFVDASANPEPRGFQILPLAPEEPRASLGHGSDPRWLLALTRLLHGRAPTACLLAVASSNLELGEGLSLLCQRAVEEAVQYISRLGGALQPSLPNFSFFLR